MVIIAAGSVSLKENILVTNVNIVIHHSFYERQNNIRKDRRKLNIKNNIYGHSGKTMLDDILDLPLSNAVVIGYLHVTLLGHAKAIILSIYRQLKPIQREQLNIQLRNQNFPHFFNRKIRSMDNFAFVKGADVRNLLFYRLLPHMNLLLSSEQYAHLVLYVIVIRLLHSGHIFGNKTNKIADRIFSRFYVDHELFYDKLQPLKLHLHAHYSYMYETHDSLCNLGCFGQESFIGAISSEHHGTRYYRDSITYYYNIDLCIQRKKIRKATIDGPHDLSFTTTNDYDYMNQIHSSLCMRNDLSSCCLIYRQFIMKNEIFHSLIYNRRQTSVSYFAQYSLANDAIEYRFGIIELFFLKKRSIKPKTQYSPSNPTTATTYHLTFDNDTKQMMIVGHSGIKRFVNDNKAVLNDGHTAKIIASVSSQKRPNQENLPSNLTTRTFDDPSCFRTQRRSSFYSFKVSSPIPSDGEEVIDDGEEVSLRRINQELQNTQEHLRDTRSENRDTHH
ncbi:unnamed protein product [Rotaria socialis]|uniref:Uncharacterized protein n=1 Tax=Rotaria socialis TaxID=392032 RepID=A0A817TCS9_9BILA|nr:unnamed protein product [Rotaria socialis]